MVNTIKNEGSHRMTTGGRPPYNVLDDPKFGSLNKTKITTVFKLSNNKPNDLLSIGLFDPSKNTSKPQSNGQQLNVVSNDLGSLYNQPDIEITHTNHQPPTDQELFGTNDIDKSTRAEKSGNERPKPLAQSKDLSRLNSRVNNLQQPIDPIKSDGRSSDYEHQVENSATSRIGYGACLLFSLFNSLRAYRYVLLHVI